ncbi:homeobox and C2H2 transcription factor, putative [Talaromyces stipitatus ATCC 10500]|uniref:Homeobox and C2H2 transcription factor, putative n=1 Tax=Talaromyces stipitatus (strain ATCC 10500 / CBS 375.48 / QM 6759 / NRRL 1006) TaxID=441959 RepID=B8M388_TALSN|nr:homeobox and C2H2 transcription factor, putative [Talaromyces stipitatus ATCC 10500]EED22260.1 homeobox and C2H2 transcription factor, putative [Talaromyces stipitatus ATCC 10500]
MEYFDFEGASFASNNVQDDDVASCCQELDEAEAVENYESLFFDKNFQLHPDSGLTADHVDNLHDQELDPQPPVEDPVVTEPSSGSQYPMFRSPLPCDFCRQMGFTHEKTPGKYLHTLQPVGEDDVTSTGGLTGRRALKSLGSSKFDHLESRGRKSGARFSRDAVRILKNWLSEHYQHPYPNEAEKDALKERTGLKRSQIANWLANARRRGKVLPSTRSSSPTPGAVDIPGSTHISSASSTTSTSSSSTLEYALMTPLERWKHSPPEHEAAATSDIIRAMANASLPPPSPSHAQQPQQQGYYAPPTMSGHGRSLSRKTGSSNDSGSLFQAPSVSSYETENKSSISDYSFASAFSHRSSQLSFNSADRKERRRRRKQMPPVPAFDRQPARGARIFQCTFCTDSFPAKYDWQRHEKSVHLALEKWTCAPRGGVITTSDGMKACAFCRTRNPTEGHLETHNYLTCQEKTVQERTFYRKDHLNQHLRLMHEVKYDSSMDQWRSTTNEIKSRCGLCDTNFTTWKDRVDHIAQHFKNGADMSQWKGDWGFEPYVQRLVENATPPYLIASERAGLGQDKTPGISHTVKTTRSFVGSSSVSLPVPTDETSFTRLENELKAFIGGQFLDGNTPTDKQIQDQARMIVYGSNDPWNQTCADNVVWLSVLKRDCGMEDLPGLENIKLEDLGMQPPFAGRMQHPPLETNSLVAGNVRHSWFSTASLGSAAISASGLQSPAFVSSSGFQSAAHSMPGSLAGSFSGSIGVSSAGPSSAIPGLSSGWSSNFSVGEQSSSDWTGSVAYADPIAQSNFDLELLLQLNDPQSQGMGIDAPIFDMEVLTSQAEMMPPVASALGKEPQSFDPLSTAMMTTASETRPISIPTTTAAGNTVGMDSYFEPSFSSQPGYN